MWDVWFVPRGDGRSKEKIGVAVDLKKWKDGLAAQTLERLVKERFGDDLLTAMRSRLEITDRPDGKVVFTKRWG